ncbi:MAG: hypothetical protein RLZZ370_512, partial [Bacteroidota bacterium]
MVVPTDSVGANFLPNSCGTGAFLPENIPNFAALMSKPPFWKQVDWKLLRRVLLIARPFRPLLRISAVLTILQGLLVGLQPYLIQQTLDVQVAGRDVSGIARMSLILLGLVLLQALVTFLSGYFSARAGQEVVRTLRNYVYEHLVALRMKFYDKTPVG